MLVLNIQNVLNTFYSNIKLFYLKILFNLTSLTKNPSSDVILVVYTIFKYEIILQKILHRSIHPTFSAIFPKFLNIFTITPWNAYLPTVMMNELRHDIFHTALMLTIWRLLNAAACLTRWSRFLLLEKNVKIRRTLLIARLYRLIGAVERWNPIQRFLYTGWNRFIRSIIQQYTRLDDCIIQECL